MGRTARFEQIYVASLEAEPVETETLTGVNSILTREIEANEIKLIEIEGIKGRIALGNNIPTKQFSIGNKLYIDKDATHVFDLKASGKADRIFINNQLSIGTTNPTKAFQVNDGDIKFSLHGSNYDSGKKKFPEKIINIEQGDMVMFPSSIFHSTVPFELKEERISLAFDILPKS